MKQGCKYCQYNKYDEVYLGSNICSVYAAHINPYSESYCEKFKAKNDKLVEKEVEKNAGDNNNSDNMYNIGDDLMD